MLRIVILLVATALLALADGSVLKTGQVESYAEDGSIVTDGSIRDDGYYRAGKMRSYSRRGEVVIDNATGLEWQDNEIVYRPWHDGPRETAEEYCSKLTFDSSSWRLPSVQELHTIVDRNQFLPPLAEGIFKNTFIGDYWSSTASDSNSSAAWFVKFWWGTTETLDKSSDLAVRCIKGKPLTSPNLIKVGNIVTDSTTGLQWQDDSTVKNRRFFWEDAINHCENILILDGYDDWRLPNINELLSIVDYAQYSPALNFCEFQNYTLSGYWSSTTIFRSSIKAWGIDFSIGSVLNSYTKSGNILYVRCVRGGQLGSPINPSIIMYLLN